MKEQLTSYETAKLAKEKGFDYPTYHNYSREGKIEPNSCTPTSSSPTRFFNDYYSCGTVDADSLCRNIFYDIWKNRTTEETYVFLAPTQSLLQKWIREIYDIHINIRHEDYFHLSKYKYFHYDISQGSLTDVTKNKDLHGDIMDECSQDIPGNHLNDEKFSKLIFEREFAFKTYEEALEHGLQEALKLIK
jgi:hypothetical protein